MSGIVLQLQRDAMDSSKPVSEVLRKAKVVATKLGLTGARQWIDGELRGYFESEARPPEYRRIHGTLKCHNPFHGMQPVMFADEKIRKAASTRLVGQSVAELEAHASGGDGVLLMHIPQLEVYTELPTYLEVSKAQVQGVLEAVRTAVLEWALQLEAQGVLGDDLQFSQEERSAAATAAPSINFYGAVTNANLQQNPIHSPQQVYIGARVDEIRDLLEKLEVVIGQAELDPAERKEAEAAVIIARSETSKPKPSAERLRNTISLLKDTLQGVSAAGQILSQITEAFVTLGS